MQANRKMERMLTDFYSTSSIIKNIGVATITHNAHVRNETFTLPQNASRRDCNGKCIELIEGNYLEVVVLLYIIVVAPRGVM